jgi:prepilin-type N-terminal cleavage/methylation domain-containing protein/prepilin-type processing-associated H-X9-DG protein
VGKANRAGFTLIELLAVVAVIAMVAALLLPVVSKAKGSAQRVQCANNLHQMGVGLQVFLDNNHSYPVLITSTNDGYPQGDRTWIAQLEREGIGISQPSSNYFHEGLWKCPSARWSHSAMRRNAEPDCYGYNAYGIASTTSLRNELALQGHYNPDTYARTGVTESEVAVPSDMIAIADDYNTSVVLMRRNLSEIASFGNFLIRHQGKANVLFCEGHIESLKLTSMFEDQSDSALAQWNRDHLPHRDQLSPASAR